MHDFDLIVVGGGINGSGIARDAPLRGLKVLLLERDDFCAGASGNNGRMIHGGLRYLEQAEFGLVREALRERATLLRIAPHLVRRRDLTIPLRAGVGRPYHVVRAGLFLLDLLGGRAAPRHRILSREETQRRLPSLDRRGLRGAAVMFDAFAEYAERLTVENLVDAAAHGAVVMNHATVERLLGDGAGCKGVAYRTASGEIVEAAAPLVVNATGAWGDEFLRQVTGADEALLGASQGTFIVVAPFAGAPEGSVFFEARSDRRPIIVTPWNGLCLVGTTDQRVTGRIDDVAAAPAEVDYLVAELAACFPGAGLSRASILYTYTGVRPLPFARGASRKVPRKHVVHDHAPALQGLLSVFGGKLSTFRSLAEEATDLALRKLRRRAPACVTATRRLPGAMSENYPAYAASFGERSSLSAQTRQRLVALYGVRADMVLSIAEERPDLAAMIDAETGAIGAEIVFVARDEWASTFLDMLIRRTLIGRNGQLGVNALDAVARICERHLGWDAARIARNRQDYQRYVELSRRFAHDPALAVNHTASAQTAEVH